MKNCIYCNHSNQDDALVCESCNKSLNSPSEEFFSKSDFLENQKVENSQDSNLLLNKITTSSFEWLEKKELSYSRLKKGDSFHEYKIVLILHKGELSNTYLIQDKDGKQFTLYIFPFYFQFDEELFFEPINEYQKKIKKSLFIILDKGKENDYYYAITSFTEGRSLSQIMQAKKERNETFRLKHAYTLVAQIAMQLQPLHPHFPHTMIHPEHIVITKDGDVFLIDFAFFLNISLANRIRESVTSGFQDFIAPELNNPSKTTQHLSDIYSLGILLYWLLTSRTPQEDFKLPKTQNDDMTLALRIFLEKAFSPDPINRFESIREFSDNLKELLNDNPTAITQQEPELEELEEIEEKDTPPSLNTPPQLTAAPPQFKKPPQFKPQSIKSKKLDIPIRKEENEFDTFKASKGDVTLGELDEVERWLFVKNDIEFGPVNAKKIRELVEVGELTPDSIIKTLTHPIEKKKLSEFDIFKNFLKDWSLKQSEKEFELQIVKDKKKKKIILAIALLLLIAGGLVVFKISTTKNDKKYVHKSLDEMKSEKTVITAKDTDSNDENSENIEEKNSDDSKGKKGKRKKKRVVKKKKIVDGKEVTVEVEVNDEEEMKKMFAENEKENTDVANVSFAKNNQNAVNLSNEEILKTINKYKGSIISCFEQEYSRTGYLPPKVEVSYDIRTDGKIYNVFINHPEYKNKKGKLNGCVIKVFQSIKFPPLTSLRRGTFPLEFEVE
ncbi:protein kinase [bacterium]|nr:protein kinase [bacterium]